jgi:hypothetical protein
VFFHLVTQILDDNVRRHAEQSQLFQQCINTIRPVFFRLFIWFRLYCNNLLNALDPWRVGPPDRNAVNGIATLLGSTPGRVNEMVAEEWYGVAMTDQSARVRGLSSRLDALGSDDAALVERIVQRLQPNKEIDEHDE